MAAAPDLSRNESVLSNGLDCLSACRTCPPAHLWLISWTAWSIKGDISFRYVNPTKSSPYAAGSKEFTRRCKAAIETEPTPHH